MRNNRIQKTFVVGDKWLYYKIYCGITTADTILLEVIKPLTNSLLENNLIEKWFFIRYADPELHLRVRFYVKDVTNLGDIIHSIKEYTEPYILSSQIWNIQIDTYQRELERYGKNSITLAETFFYYDSEQIVSIIEHSSDEETRILAVFKYLEMIIKLFNLTNVALISFLNNMQHNFKEEFKADRNMRKELSNTYRVLEPLLTTSHLTEDKKSKQIITRIYEMAKEDNLLVPLESLLASFIHMTINRSFIAQQRLYEMMLYHFLYRKTKSKYVRYGKL